MDDLELLRAAVAAAPRDLAARLVLADAEQERGDDAAAELLRVRVEIERLAAPPLVSPMQVDVRPQGEPFELTPRLTIRRPVLYLDLVVPASSDMWPEGTIVDVLLPAPGDKIVYGVRVLCWAYQVFDDPPDKATLECILEEDTFPHRKELAPLRRRERELDRICNLRTYFA